MAEPHVVILGGGPAGCGAAYQLHRTGKGRATLVEQQKMLGGNAASFNETGIWLDFGSHRMHSACDPAILADLQRLLGDDMRLRDRHGRIRLRGKWLHFPLKAADLMLELDRSFAAGALRDMVSKTVFGAPDEGDTFASVLRANLGPTICEHFYFPYARKIWGREPEELSGIQARKRVSAGTFAKLLKRLVKAPGDGKFWYFREGYGQISRVLAAEGQRLGADIRMGWKAASLEHVGGGGRPWRVTLSRGDEKEVLEADHVWSTIPVTVAARMLTPAAPPEVIEATQKIDYRAMVLVYLELDVDQFTPTDAHYFPEANVTVTRLSEPKNYFGLREPAGRTTLCAELPCASDDRIWAMTDAELGAHVAADMERAGLPLPRPPVRVFSRRLRQAYPIYTLGYERWLRAVDDWISAVPDFLSYGRQGLFAHDNTHHALFMANAAVDCLGAGGFDHAKWADYRRIFATHVVED
jgi:protoporphyrinogen oxidase